MYKTMRLSNHVLKIGRAPYEILAGFPQFIFRSNPDNFVLAFF